MLSSSMSVEFHRVRIYCFNVFHHFFCLPPVPAITANRTIKYDCVCLFFCVWISIFRNACSGFYWSLPGLRESPDLGSARFVRKSSTTGLFRCSGLRRLRSMVSEQHPIPQYLTPHVAVPTLDCTSFLQFNYNGQNRLYIGIYESEEY